jgi:hypothetical protein
MKTYCYKNLQTGSWSIQQKVDGRMTVVAHCDHVELAQVSIKQNDNLLHKIRSRNRRGVCTMAVGELMTAQGVTIFKGRPLVQAKGAWNSATACLAGREVTFNPHRDDYMVYRDNRGEQFMGSDYAVFTADKKMMVAK